MDDYDCKNNDKNETIIIDLLSHPFDAILLHEIVPSFFTIKDFLQLSRVSKRYRLLLHPTPPSSSSYHPLRMILQRDYGLLLGNNNDNKKPIFLVEQPPSFQPMTPLQKVIQKEDPWSIIKLHRSALRRRRLVVLQRNSNSSSPPPPSCWQLWQPIIQECKALRYNKNNFLPASDVPAPSRRHSLNFYTRTQFVCVNESNVDIYCHWIDWDGSVENRGETDLIRPGATFHHTSQVSHAFLLCWEQRDRPFALYQQRRCWFTCNRFQHVHAIKVLGSNDDGSIIEELYGTMDMENNHRLRWYHPEALQPSQIISANYDDNFPSRPVNFFCGTFVPKIQDPVWRREDIRVVRRCAGITKDDNDEEDLDQLATSASERYRWLREQIVLLRLTVCGKQELLSCISVHQQGEAFWRDVWSHFHPL